MYYVKQWVEVYLLKAHSRIQALLEGVQLTLEDVHAMQLMCAYEVLALFPIPANADHNEYIDHRSRTLQILRPIHKRRMGGVRLHGRPLVLVRCRLRLSPRACLRVRLCPRTPLAPNRQTHLALLSTNGQPIHLFHKSHLGYESHDIPIGSADLCGCDP